MIHILLAFFAASILATSIADTASAQQLVQRRDVSCALALAIATGAVDACRALGFTSSAVVVVGRGGDTIIAASDDNARPHAMEAARRKAQGTARPLVSGRAGAAAEHHVARRRRADQSRQRRDRRRRSGRLARQRRAMRQRGSGEGQGGARVSRKERRHAFSRATRAGRKLINGLASPKPCKFQRRRTT